jgi:hypothetical protein
MSVLALALLTVFAFSQPAVAPGVFGRIQDERCEEKEGVRVQAFRLGGNLANSCHSKTHGFYLLRLSPQQYTLIFESLGYEDMKRMIIVESGEPQLLNVQLHRQGVYSPEAPCPPVYIEDITVSGTLDLPVVTGYTTAGSDLKALPLTTRSYVDIVSPATRAVATGGSSANNFLSDAGDANRAPQSAFGSPTAAAGSLSEATSVTVNVAGRPAELAGTSAVVIEMRPIDTLKQLTGEIELRVGSGGNTRPEAVPQGLTDNLSEQASAARGGGPIVADRLWFFGSATLLKIRAQSGRAFSTVAQGKATERTVETSAKVNYHYTPSITGRLLAFIRQEQRFGALGDLLTVFGGDAAVNKHYERRIVQATIEHDGIVSDYSFGSVHVTAVHVGSTFQPETAISELPQIRDVDRQFFASGGGGFTTDHRSDRRLASVLKWNMLIPLVGTHSLTAGAGFDGETSHVRDRLTGLQLIDFIPAASRPVYIHHFFAATDNTPALFVDDRVASSVTSGYVQDSWAHGPVFINAGVRWDAQRVESAGRVLSVNGVAQPRVGLAYDIRPNARQKLFASFSRYAEPLSGDEGRGLLSRRRIAATANFDPLRVGADPAAEIIAGGTFGVRGDLAADKYTVAGRATDEISAGGFFEVADRGWINLTLIRRRLDRTIVDLICSVSGERCIGNPGAGTLTELKPRLDYRSAVLRATFPRVPYQPTLTYVLSRATGNFDPIEYRVTRSTGIDPYSLPTFDDPATVSSVGPLIDDRRHRVELSLLRHWPVGEQGRLDFGADAWWYSGTPITRYGYSQISSRYTRVLGTRGGEGRGPATYDTNLRLDYTMRDGVTKLVLSFGIRHLINLQAPLYVDQRSDFREGENASPLPTNPTFSLPMVRETPRAWTLAGKLSF